MDKIFSARMDEDLIRQVNRFVKERSITKKGLIEQALKTYLDQVGSNIESDIVDRSFDERCCAPCFVSRRSVGFYPGEFRDGSGYAAKPA